MPKGKIKTPQEINRLLTIARHYSWNNQSAVEALAVIDALEWVIGEDEEGIEDIFGSLETVYDSEESSHALLEIEA